MPDMRNKGISERGAKRHSGAERQRNDGGISRML